MSNKTNSTRPPSYHGGIFSGWIDLGKCEFIDQRKGWDRGDAFDLEGLFVTRDGRFLVDISTIKSEYPCEQVERYAVFITELQAAGWFADDPESASACMRPLVEKFDLTRAPAARLEPAAAPAPSRNGITAMKCTPSMEATDRRFLLALDELKALDRKHATKAATALKRAGIDSHGRNKPNQEMNRHPDGTADRLGRGRQAVSRTGRRIGPQVHGRALCQAWEAWRSSRDGSGWATALH
jgi:hypothetical protein